MSRHNKDLGDFGEAIARRYLEKQGFKILEKNYRTKFGEIDLICTADKKLIFVEVKTRKSDAYGRPAEAVTDTKIKHMKLAAEKYYSRHQSDAEVRFDVIEVYASKVSGGFEYESLNHIENIDVF